MFDCCNMHSQHYMMLNISAVSWGFLQLKDFFIFWACFLIKDKFQ